MSIRHIADFKVENAAPPFGGKVPFDIEEVKEIRELLRKAAESPVPL